MIGKPQPIAPAQLGKPRRARKLPRLGKLFKAHAKLIKPPQSLVAPYRIANSAVAGAFILAIVAVVVGSPATKTWINNLAAGIKALIRQLLQP